LSREAILITNFSTIFDGSGAVAQQLRIFCDITTVNDRVVLTEKAFDVTEFRTGDNCWHSHGLVTNRYREILLA
jgi:hypothetical protein